MPESKYQSYGQKIVRTSFNPDLNWDVDRIKRDTAALIDFVHDHLHLKNGRLAELAINAYEEAAMLAVKAATTE